MTEGVARPRRLSARLWASASGALALTTTVVYVALIATEGDNAFWEVFPWVALMLIGTGAMVTSASARERAVGRAFALGGAGVLGILGVVAMFSVGLGFLLAAGAAVLAAVRPG